jgi:hypothetical protein
MIWQKSNTTYTSGHREREKSVASIWYGTFKKYLEAQQQCMHGYFDTLYFLSSFKI